MDDKKSATQPLEKEYWRGKSFAFFTHRTCECFPCHAGIDPDNFNCLFCFCPLYMLGDRCGGRFKYAGNGIKDCSNCSVPHIRSNYGYITERFNEIVQAMKHSG